MFVKISRLINLYFIIIIIIHKIKNEKKTLYKKDANQQNPVATKGQPK